MLVEGGQAQLAFQKGPDTTDVRPDAYGSKVALTLYHHSVAGVTESLNAAGFIVQEAIQRQAELPARPRLKPSSPSNAAPPSVLAPAATHMRHLVGASSAVRGG